MLDLLPPFREMPRLPSPNFVSLGLVQVKFGLFCLSPTIRHSTDHGGQIEERCEIQFIAEQVEVLC